MANFGQSQASASSPIFPSGNMSGPPLNQLLNQITSIKMERTNFLLWQNLAWPILRSYRLEGYLTGEKPCPSRIIQRASVEGASPSEGSSNVTVATAAEEILNPAFESWIAVDQLILGWLYNSMSQEIAVQVMGYQTSRELWIAVQELFGVQSRAEIDYLKRLFQQTRKGSSKMTDYLTLMKRYSDGLALAGSPVLVSDLVSQVLAGLDEEYNPVIVSIQGKRGISWTDLQSDLLSYENRLEYQLTMKTHYYKKGIT